MLLRSLTPLLGAALAACGPDQIAIDGPPPCPEPIVDVELGNYTTCALTGSGRLRCFGLFYWLDAWLASSDPPWAVPWVEFPSRPIAVANNGRLCVLLADGRQGCANHVDGFVEPPVQLELGAKPIATTGNRVLLEDGRLFERTDDTFVEIETPGPVAQFAQDPLHTCLVTRDGVVACMGANDYSGNGTKMTCPGSSACPGSPTARPSCRCPSKVRPGSRSRSGEAARGSSRANTRAGA